MGLFSKTKTIEERVADLESIVAEHWSFKELVRPQILILEKAKKEVGQKEITGKENNERIVEYLKSCGLNTGDETAWCSAFVNWCVESCGYIATNSASARSWLEWGNSSMANPQVGDIAVFWREKPDGWKGHVGFIYEISPNGDMQILAGNQGNSVSIVPYTRARLLDVRTFSDKQIKES